MADINATKRRIRAQHTGTRTSIDAIRAAMQARIAGRPVQSGKTAIVIQAHLDAVGRGEPSVSPAKARLSRN